MKKIFNVKTIVKLLPLFLIILFFILYRAYKWFSSESAQQEEGFQNAEKKYVYIPNIKTGGGGGVGSGGGTTEESKNENGANEVDPTHIEFTYSDLVKDTCDFIDFLKFDHFKLVDRENIGKYELDVANTKMYAKKKELGNYGDEGSIVQQTLEKDFGVYFDPEINETMLLTFNEAITPHNYLVNAIGKHMYYDNAPIEPEVHKFKNYYIEQLGVFMGNKTKMDGLKREFYEWIIPATKMRKMVEEYMKIMPYSTDANELPYLLDYVKDELQKTAEMECSSEWLRDEIVFYLFQYVQIIRPVYSLLTSPELFNRKQLTLNVMTMREFESRDEMNRNIVAKLYFSE